jgi:hypothetical protein
MSGFPSKPIPMNPELEELLKNLPPMTKEQEIAQRLSFVAASLHLDRQEISREKWLELVKKAAERVYDDPPLPIVSGKD